MGRIRYLKPQFFFDTDLAKLSIPVRMFYQGLWCQADRAGRLRDDPQFLKAQIFPYDKISAETCLATLSEAKPHSGRGFISRYVGADGEQYIQILEWSKHQKPHHSEKDSEIPPQTPSTTTITDTLTIKQQESVSEAAIGSLTGIDVTPVDTMSKQKWKISFDMFWECWPKKVDRDNAILVWMRLTPSQDLLNRILASVKFWAAHDDWMREGKKWIPGPAKWLRGGRWKDEQAVAVATDRKCYRCGGPADGVGKDDTDQEYGWCRKCYPKRWEAKNG